MLERKLSFYEFVEKVYGVKLMAYQRKILKLMNDLPKDSYIVMGRKGPIILNSDGKKIIQVKRHMNGE